MSFDIKPNVWFKSMTTICCRYVRQCQSQPRRRRDNNNNYVGVRSSFGCIQSIFVYQSNRKWGKSKLDYCSILFYIYELFFTNIITYIFTLINSYRYENYLCLKSTKKQQNHFNLQHCQY